MACIRDASAEERQGGKGGCVVGVWDGGSVGWWECGMVGVWDGGSVGWWECGMVGWIDMIREEG
jgi:hypothetical protein